MKFRRLTPQQYEEIAAWDGLERDLIRVLIIGPFVICWGGKLR